MVLGSGFNPLWKDSVLNMGKAVHIYLAFEDEAGEFVKEPVFPDDYQRIFCFEIATESASDALELVRLHLSLDSNVLTKAPMLLAKWTRKGWDYDRSSTHKADDVVYHVDGSYYRNEGRGWEGIS